MSVHATARVAIPEPLLRPVRQLRRSLASLRLDGSTLVLNFVVQRVFRVNADCPWSVHYTSRIIAPWNLRIEGSSARSLAVSGGCYIQALNGVRIGPRCLIGPGVKIISANHTGGATGDGHDGAAPIAIGARCWIAANAVILPGVTLGDGTVVGAGAVVTRSWPGGTVLVGNPARPLESHAA